MKRLAGMKELLDGPLDRRLLAGNLRDLERVNRWLGGSVLSRRAVVALLSGRAERHGPIELLDVGTGAGDIPAALVPWFAARGLELRVTACDTRPEIVAEARTRTERVPGLTVDLVGDTALPYLDRRFDIAHVSMVIHHLDEPEASRMLGELWRVSRLGVVVNDLDRSEAAWLGALALTRVATRNGYTRTDAPLSVRRAWRPSEAALLGRRAGLREVARFTHPFGYRYAIAFEHERVD